MNTIIFNNESRISSLDIAEITGKNHKDVMKAIRNMEPAWIKIGERNFALTEYVDNLKHKHPCYLLTKTECLYIATKFNDEARAKLVLRWYELEQQEQERQQQSQLQMMQVLNDLHPLAQLGSLALSGTNCIYFADMAKILTQRGYKIGQNQLFQLLRDKGYIYKNSTRPMQVYVEQGLFQLKETFYDSKLGRRAGVTTMITAKGQEHLLNLFTPSLF